MHQPQRHVHNVPRGDVLRRTVEGDAPATPPQVQHLVQPGVAMGGKVPVVQPRSGLNRFTMHHIGQIAQLSEQVDVQNLRHVFGVMFESYKSWVI